MKRSDLKIYGRAMAFFVAVLLMITSVVWDFPVNTGIRTKAAASFTFYTNGSPLTTFSCGRVDNNNPNGYSNNTALTNGKSVTGAANRIMYINNDKTALYNLNVLVDKGTLSEWTTQNNVTRMANADTVGNTDFNNILLQFIPETPITTVNYAYSEGGNPIKIANSSIAVEAFSNYTSTELDKDTFISVKAGDAKDGYLYIGWLSSTGGKKTRNYEITNDQGYNSGNGGTFTATYAKKYPITYKLADGCDGTISPKGSDFYAYWAPNQQYVKDALGDDSDKYSVKGASVTNIDTSNYIIEWRRTDTNAVVSTAWDFVPDGTLIESILAGGNEPVFAATVAKRITVNYIQGGTGKNRLNGAGANATVTAEKNPSYYYPGLEDSEQTDFSSATASDTNANDWLYWQDDDGNKIISGYNTAEITLDTIKDYISAHPDVTVINLTATSTRTKINIVNEEGFEAGGALSRTDSILQLNDVISSLYQITLNVNTAGGYEFDHWEITSDNGTKTVGSSTSIRELSGVTRDDFLNDAAYTLTACYKRGERTLSFTQENLGYGDIYIDDELQSSGYGDIVMTYGDIGSGTVSARSVDGAAFDHWVSSSGRDMSAFGAEISLTDLGEIREDETFTAYYTIDRANYVEIRYEVRYNKDDYYKFPIKLTLLGTDKSVSSKAYVGSNDPPTKYNQGDTPYISEIIPTDGSTAPKGCDAAPFDEGGDQVYSLIGWWDANNGIIQDYDEELDNSSYTPSESDYIDYIGTEAIVFRANGRRLQNYYIMGEIVGSVGKTNKIFVGADSTINLSEDIFFLGADANNLKYGRGYVRIKYGAGSNILYANQNIAGYIFDYWEFDGIRVQYPDGTDYGNDGNNADLVKYINEYLSEKAPTQSDQHIYLIKAHFKELPCTITINKTIDTAPVGFGKASFIFKVSGTEHTDYTEVDYSKTVTLSENNKSGSVTFTVPRGEYTITELDTLRYDISEQSGAPTGTYAATVKVEGMTVLFEQGGGEVEFTIENALQNYGKRSYSDSNVNHITIPAASP